MDAYNNSLSNGGYFEKSVKAESLPVLDAIRSRTIELKTAHGWNFYPKFSVTEVSKITGMNKNKTEECMNDLIGVLAVISINYPTWFIPKQRMGLAYEILKINDVV